jgi:Helix-loop-helix DNA-binding domain
VAIIVADDDDAIVDVVTVSTMINERPNDAFSPTNLKAMVGLINAWHCYCSPMSLATQRALAKASSRETKFKLVLSPERHNSASSMIDCSVPTSRSLATSRKNRCRRREARDRVTDEQRVKREALNDLERNRRREMTRELTSLRVVVPGVRDNPRAPKVTILDSAAHHIRFLERLLARNEALLAEQHQKMAELKALC